MNCKKTLLLISFLIIGAGLVSAQENGIPKDVFYLMPEFQKGSIIYNGKAPSTGTMNICAVDNSVRFIDNSGQEMVATIDNSVLRVVIGDVTFEKNGILFMRLIPVNDEVSVAVKRDILIMNDSKVGGYGMASQTTSITEYSSINTEGRIYRLDEVREFPYRMTESATLFYKGSFLQPNKKSFQKCFPDKKDEIEAYFKSNGKLSAENIEAITELCNQWGH